MQQDHLKAQYLDDTYEDLSTLKENVYVVRHKQTGKIYVKKYVDKKLIPIYKKLQQIHDHHIEKSHDHAADNEKGIIITEYISGMTLQEYIEDKGIFSQQGANSIIEDLLLVLEKIHMQGIIHRDINPNNILISNDGIVKLIDFNIARQKKQAQGADTSILGTVGYAAPEQYGFLQTDERTDIYAIGVLWNVLLTGHLPSEQRYACGPLGMIIQRCTEMDNRQRYHDVQEILQTMEKYNLRCPVHIPSDDNIKNDNKDIHTWIPGFRTGTLWKCIVASLGYCLMTLYSIDYIQKYSSTWQSLIREIAALLLYIWLAPLIAADIGYFDQKVSFLKDLPAPVRLTIRIFLCLPVFYLGALLES